MAILAYVNMAYNLTEKMRNYGGERSKKNAWSCLGPITEIYFWYIIWHFIFIDGWVPSLKMIYDYFSSSYPCSIPKILMMTFKSRWHSHVAIRNTCIGWGNPSKLALLLAVDCPTESGLISGVAPFVARCHHYQNPSETVFNVHMDHSLERSTMI